MPKISSINLFIYTWIVRYLCWYSVQQCVGTLHRKYNLKERIMSHLPFYKEPLTCAWRAKSSKSALIVSADQLITILCESQQVERHFKGEANSGSAVSSAVGVRSRISTEQASFHSHPDCRTCLEGILLFFGKKEGKEFVLSSLSLLFLAVGPRLSPSGFGCKTPGRDRSWKKNAFWYLNKFKHRNSATFYGVIGSKIHCTIFFFTACQWSPQSWENSILYFLCLLYSS